MLVEKEGGIYLLEFPIFHERVPLLNFSGIPEIQRTGNPRDSCTLASILFPKLKKSPFNFLKLAIGCFFQKVYFSVYIDTSRE
jgi:hypothetical protein